MSRAGRIEVIRRGGICQVLVDGQELPAALPRDSDVIVTVHPDTRPTVTVTLTADRVDVTDTLFDEKDTDR
jgi:quinolinate synthase